MNTVSQCLPLRVAFVGVVVIKLRTTASHLLLVVISATEVSVSKHMEVQK